MLIQQDALFILIKSLITSYIVPSLVQPFRSF